MCSSDLIVGAASSAVTLGVIDRITAAGVVQFSPANTAAELTTYPDRGLYFRTAPSDLLQAGVLATLVTGDGHRDVAVINRDDAYGTGLADALATSLAAAGARVVVRRTYAEGVTAFAADVDELARRRPDAVVVIGFEESSRILAAMVAAGIGPARVAVYGTAGNMANALGENLEKGV